MKKSTKAMSIALSAMLAVGGLAGCFGKNNKVKAGDKEIVIKVRSAGFGVDWLYELETQFEAAYANEGYQVKILNPSNAIHGDMVVNELVLGYDKVGVDLYITSGITPETVGVNGVYGALVEDIGASVYDQPAISYSGEAEASTVSQKVSQDVVDYMTDSTGARYAYCWAQTSGGLAVNTKKLAKYGLEIPKTTNEMFDCFEKIYCGHNGVGNSNKTGTYPITYISGGNGYAVTYLHTLIAQYSKDYFDTLWSFQTKDAEGNVANLSDAECQELYNSPAILEMLKIAYRAFDRTIASPGSLSQSVDQAQAKIMDEIDDGAVFMFNGDWMLNEVKQYYPDKLHDIDFVNFPVMSAIGTKLFGAGTSYNFDDAKCEELLSYIIGLVDENKSLEEIIADVKTVKGVDITEADAAEVARARGVTYSRGMEHVAYVTKGSTKKDIASLFLRMMSSDDFGKTFLKSANGSTPYYAAENSETEYQFVKSASKVTANRYFSFVSTFGGARGYRQQLNIQPFFTSVSHIPDHIAEKSKASLYTKECTLQAGVTVAVYEDAAKELQSGEVSNIKKNWDKYLQSAGLK